MSLSRGRLIAATGYWTALDTALFCAN